MGWFASNTDSQKSSDGLNNQDNNVSTIVKNEITVNNDVFLTLLIIIAVCSLINLLYNVYKSHIKNVKRSVRRENPRIEL